MSSSICAASVSPTRAIGARIRAALPAALAALSLACAAAVAAIPEKRAPTAPLDGRAPAATPADARSATEPGSRARDTEDASRPPFVDEMEKTELAPARRPPAATHLTIVTGREIGHGVSPAIDDALRGVGGFRLFRRTSSVVAHPTTMGASLRGGGPSGTGRAGVTLDGLPIEDPFGGWVMWSRVPKLLLGGALVSRPGAPLGATGEALAGAVALELRTAADRLRLFELRLGSNATLEVGSALADPAGPGHLSVEARRFQTDGYAVVREEDRGDIDVPAFSETTLVDAGWSGAVSSRLDVTARVNAFADERGNGTPLTGNETDGVTASVRFRSKEVLGDTAWLVTAFASDQSFANRFSAQAADRDTERPALDQRAVPSSSQGVIGLTAGPRVESSLYVKRLAGEVEERYSFVGDSESGGFTRERRAGGEQLVAGGAARFDAGGVEVSLGLDYWRNGDGARIEQEVETGVVTREELVAGRSRLIPAIRVARHRSRDGAGLDKWWAAASVSGRPPTLNELYRPFRVRNEITESNGGLEPELRSGVDAGLVWRPGGTSRTQMTLSGYWNVVSDAIANVTLATGPGRIAPCGFVPAGGVCRQRKNVGRADLAGLELELESALAARWGAELSLQVTDAEVRRAPSGSELEGKRIAQVPRQAARLVLTHRRSRVSARLVARYEGEQFDDDLNRRALDAFVSIDARVDVRVANGWTIFAGVENALDTEIETGLSSDGVVSVGVPRQLWAGIGYAGGD